MCQERLCVKRDFVSRGTLCQERLCVKRDFVSKETLCQKRLCVKRDFVSRETLCQRTLCSSFVGTLKHILCRCPHAINEEPQSRITWRHDSILLAWKKAIEHQVESTAGKPGKNPGCIQFQSAGLLEAEKSIKGKHNGVKWNAQLLCVEIGARGA